MLLLILAALSGLSCSLRGAGVGGGTEGGPVPPEARLERLQQRHDALQKTLDSLLALDPVVREAEVNSGQVVLAIRVETMKGLIGEVTRRYLRQVELDLRPTDLRVHEAGDLHSRVAMAAVTAGRWDVQLQIHRIQGVLRARYPRIDVTRTNRIHLIFPVTLERARGVATLDFRWRSRPLVRLVCKDFDVHHGLSGRILPADYRIDGDFVLTNSGQTLLAWPEFPREKYRLRVDLSPESWAQVRGALEGENRLERCGLLMNPENVMRKLRELGGAGFQVKLPRSIFRTVELPAGVSQAVVVADRRVDLQVQPRTLRVTPRAFWYGALVRTRVSASGAGSE